MPDPKKESSLSGIELTTNIESNPVIPNWLSEALLLGRYWVETGLLDRLQQQVRVNRGRMGNYEVCDFVLLLLAYAVSGEKTLKDFFAALKPVKAVLMASWQRNKTPVASSLSRFLEDIDNSSLETLRTLFEKDLWERGFKEDDKGGLIDRTGQKYYLFDVDGTKQAARQRSLTSKEEYPRGQRRSRKACKKGYGARKRGEGIRTRSAITQAHTSEWLGTFGSPGNGSPLADLKRACLIIQQYLQQHKLPGNRAIVRLDGYYGVSKFVNEMQQHQLGYLLRSRDYGLLEHQSIQTRLEATDGIYWSHPECHQSPEVFDLGFVEDSWAGYTEPVRVIVVRTPNNPERKRNVGKKKGDFIYELFITSHLPTGLSGCDILSLYYGRGGFEKQLGDEDVEQDSDRWCSWHPQGQEFWQILSQWVWNWRLWVGNAHQPQALRHTIWSPAEPQNLTAPDNPTSTDEPLQLSSNSSPKPDSNPEASKYGPMQVAQGWAKSLNKFSGDDFTIINEKALICPASQKMYRRETRYNRYGDKLILFSTNPRLCQECSLKSKCLADGSKGNAGRRITVICKNLSHLEEKSSETLSPQSLATTPPMEHNPSTATNQPTKPVLWLDFPTTRLRRDLTYLLRQQQLVIEPMSEIGKKPSLLPNFITRDQRAHRRLSWTQRWERNSIIETQARWQVTLFGISSAVLDWLTSLKPQPALII